MNRTGFGGASIRPVRFTELTALESARTLIPPLQAHHRERIAHGAGVPIAALPCAAELIDIADGHERWRPAAERVLRTFGLHLLVPEQHSKAVQAYINDHDMSGIVDCSIVTAASASAQTSTGHPGGPAERRPETLSESESGHFHKSLVRPAEGRRTGSRVSVAQPPPRR